MQGHHSVDLSRRNVNIGLGKKLNFQTNNILEMNLIKPWLAEQGGSSARESCYWDFATFFARHPIADCWLARDGLCHDIDVGDSDHSHEIRVSPGPRDNDTK